MKRVIVSVCLFTLSAGAFIGCDRPASPATPTGSTRPPSDKGDVHVRTPGVAVDVEHKDGGKGVDVDVRRKER